MVIKKKGIGTKPVNRLSLSSGEVVGILGQLSPSLKSFSSLTAV